MARRPTKKGAPTRELVHFLPGSWWSTDLSQRSGKSHGELDRLLTDQSARLKQDGSLKAQLYRMKAIAEGRLELQLHRPNHVELRRRAEALQAGVEAGFLSVTWDELIQAHGFQRRQPFRLDLVSKDLIADLQANNGIADIHVDGVELTREGFMRCGATTHLDALGLLLMQKRLRQIPVLEVPDIFFIRLWLGQATDIAPFKSNRARILEAISAAYPEFGPLQGEEGVYYVSTDEQITEMRARYLLKFSGVSRMIWISPYPKRRPPPLISTEQHGS